MIFKDVLIIFGKTNLSPEQLSMRLGVSNMTYRRWMKMPDDHLVPKLYMTGIIEGIYQLIGESKIDPSLPEVQSFLKQYALNIYYTALSNLGFSQDDLAGGGSDQEKLNYGLSKIGSNKENQTAVNKSKRRINSFKNFGEKWSEALDILLSVISSSKINKINKIVAFGALFYLINPFDVIPDYIPVFGYLDDFSVITLVSTFYLGQFPLFLKKKDYEIKFPALRRRGI